MRSGAQRKDNAVLLRDSARPGGEFSLRPLLVHVGSREGVSLSDPPLPHL